MAKKTINLGTGELTGDGESIRSAFDKINDNFDELYTQDTNDVVLSSINASLIPDTDVAYDLGSATNRFRDLYLSGSTIDLGGTTLSVVGGTLQIGGVDINDVVTDAGVDYSSIQNTPNLSQYVKYTDLQDSTITIDVNSTGDLQGNVYGDDSTLLVDGMAGKIVGPVDTASITQSDTGSFTSNFTTTITQDNQYTKFTKVDVFDDGDIVDTINREIKLGDNRLLFDSTVGASATIRNNSVGGSLVLEAGTGIADEGNADGGDIYITSGYPGVGGDGGKIVLNSNADIFIGPLANTLDIRIGGGPGYAGENNTFFYGNVNIDSGKKLDTESVTNSSGNLTLDSTSGAVIIGTNATQTIINGDVDFGNSGDIDFTGASVTGLNYEKIRPVDAANAPPFVDFPETLNPDTHSGMELISTPTGAPRLTLPDGSYNGQTYFVTQNYQGGSDVEITVTNYYNKATEAIETVTVTGGGQFVWTGTWWTKIG